MAHVKPWGWNGSDEKLAAVCAWACVGHRKEAWLVERDVACALVFKVLSPDGLPSHSGAGWVTTLNHELFDDAVENDAVVVAVLEVCGEVFASLWCDVFEELELNTALCGFEDDVCHSLFG